MPEIEITANTPNKATPIRSSKARKSWPKTSKVILWRSGLGIREKHFLKSFRFTNAIKNPHFIGDADIIQLDED
jgi:hypothetical protein